VGVPAKQSTGRYSKPRSLATPVLAAHSNAFLTDTLCHVRISDDEEDDARAADAARRADARHSNRDRERDRDRDAPRRTGGGRRGQFEDDEDDYDLPEDGRRGGNGPRGSRNQRDEAYPSSSSGGNNARGSGGRGYVEEVDRDRRRDRDADTGGKWAGATGGRDVQQQQAASGGDSRYRAEVASVPAHIPTPGKNNTQQAAQHPSSAPMQIVPPDLSDMRAFLTSPLPRNVGTLQCYIRRNKSGTNKLFPIYSLYLKVRAAPLRVNPHFHYLLCLTFVLSALVVAAGGRRVPDGIEEAPQEQDLQLPDIHG
jgi:hypothetical protein